MISGTEQNKNLKEK